MRAVQSSAATPIHGAATGSGIRQKDDGTRTARKSSLFQQPEDITMTVSIRLVAAVLVMGVAACGSESKQRPIQESDYGGTGDLMARCMQHASESYCEREVWGGHER